jgi:hypothetical protein
MTTTKATNAKAKAWSKLSPIGKARREFAENKKRARNTQNRRWEGASKIPMFSRETRSSNEGGSTTTRTVRLLNKSVFQTLLSGATAVAVDDLREDLQQSGLEFEATAPRSAHFTATLTPGARLAIGQFVTAYVQESALVAARMNQAFGTKKRVGAPLMASAFADTNASIFNAATPYPRKTTVVTFAKKPGDSNATRAPTGGKGVLKTREAEQAEVVG